MSTQRFAVVLVVLAALSLASNLVSVPTLIRQVSGWTALAVLPGAALCLLLFRKTTLIEFSCLTAGLGVPLAGGVALLFYTTGMTLEAASTATICLFLSVVLVRVFL